jgi:hypothetical protein
LPVEEDGQIVETTWPMMVQSIACPLSENLLMSAVTGQAV